VAGTPLPDCPSASVVDCIIVSWPYRPCAYSSARHERIFSGYWAIGWRKGAFTAAAVGLVRDSVGLAEALR